MTKSFIFEAYQTFYTRYFATFLRKFGQSLYHKGIHLSRGQLGIDRIQPCHTRVKINEMTPNYSKYSFIAPNNTIVGNITIGDNSNIYYNNNLKTGFKDSSIIIGENTNIQDLNIIRSNNGSKTQIGKNVYIGSNCYLEDCIVEDEAIIGNGSKLMKNSIVRKRGFVGAGSVLSEGDVVGENEVWVGAPARFLRMAEGEENDYREELLEQFNKLSFILADQHDKEGSKLEFDKQNLGSSYDLFGKDRDYIGDDVGTNLSAQEQLNSFNFRYEANDYIKKKEYLENRGKFNTGNDYDMQNFPEHLNIHKKNYRIDEKFEDELLDNPTSDKKFFEKEQENSVDSGFSRKF